VISDDGLQHYRLGRDVEMALVDGVRRFGNQRLLPAGPLRESTARLRQVDFVIINGGEKKNDFTMLLEPLHLVALNSQQKISLSDFPHKKVHAVAGIGHPEPFFNMLKQAGLEVITHIFPDHHLYQHNDIHFNDDLPILMTEKDAVKCRTFADERCWYLKITAKMTKEFAQALEEKIQQIKSREMSHDRKDDVRKRSCSIARCNQHSDMGESNGPFA
jgi:tetraacyldisaccharide 4'-kinase